MLSRRTVITGIRETTYGTDPAMIGSNGILAYDVDLDVKGEVLAREILRDSISPAPHVIGMKECTLTFKVELNGAGLTGTVPTEPELGVLLSGCGFNTGVNTGTTRVYSLVSDEASMKSLAFRVYKDGNLHKVLGCRGNVKIPLEAGKYGVAEFEFSGLFDPVTASTIMDVAGVSNNLPPIVYNSSFNIGGFTPVCSKAEIDLGNAVSRRDDLNATYGVQGFRLTARKPTLAFDADAVVEASNPFWGDWEGSVVDTFGIQIGSNAGNIVKLSGIFQYETNKYGDQDGVSKYDCKAALVASNINSSNDELTITLV